jgi:hypothetical protein
MRSKASARSFQALWGSLNIRLYNMYNETSKCSLPSADFDHYHNSATTLQQDAVTVDAAVAVDAPVMMTRSGSLSPSWAA